MKANALRCTGVPYCNSSKHHHKSPNFPAGVHWSKLITTNISQCSSKHSLDSLWHLKHGVDLFQKYSLTQWVIHYHSQHSVWLEVKLSPMFTIRRFHVICWMLSSRDKRLLIIQALLRRVTYCRGLRQVLNLNSDF